ncbi:hypothetical protein MKW94_000743 [Papaver nudicaule]|uniref:Uncharacterized protein n=1 Tax=Papaver nudicaule TaxID=74823 RepID=A0AA41RWV9_PAPNU|nr:hypothetical protein [Papaver nudicaule]
MAAPSRSEEEITRLFRIRRTVLQMLNDRGYLVNDFEINETRAGFLAKFGDRFRREDLEFKKYKRNDDNDPIYVFFPDDEKVGVGIVRTYCNRMKIGEVHRAIMVAKQNLTPMAKKCISGMASDFHLEVFQSYTLKETQLPRIQITHPIARYYGLKRGQVVKITGLVKQQADTSHTDTSFE